MIKFASSWKKNIIILILIIKYLYSNFKNIIINNKNKK